MASDKERAEHVMLVDLARNDLGRVCAPGSVRIERFMDVERYSHVMHIVSRVFGQIAEPARRRERCCGRHSPPAPSRARPRCGRCRSSPSWKGRRRGAYAGAVGYLGFGGDMDTCIAIRTMVLRERRRLPAVRRRAWLPTPSPEGEYQEAMNKVAALAVAIDQAETGVYGP